MGTRCGELSFNPIPTGLGHVTLIYGLIPPMAGRNRVKGKTHDLNHDLTYSEHTINCVCHSIKSMFRVLGMYNFALSMKFRGFKLSGSKSFT